MSNIRFFQDRLRDGSFSYIFTHCRKVARADREGVWVWCKGCDGGDGAEVCIPWKELAQVQRSIRTDLKERKEKRKGLAKP